MKPTLKQLTRFLAAFLLGYFAAYGLNAMLLDLARSYAAERRRALIAQLKPILFTRDNCPHCEHWHNEGMECCLCRMPPKEAEEKEPETVTVN